MSLTRARCRRPRKPPSLHPTLPSSEMSRWATYRREVVARQKASGVRATAAKRVQCTCFLALAKLAYEQQCCSGMFCARVQRTADFSEFRVFSENAVRRRQRHCGCWTVPIMPQCCAAAAARQSQRCHGTASGEKSFVGGENNAAAPLSFAFTGGGGPRPISQLLPSIFCTFSQLLLQVL